MMIKIPDILEVSHFTEKGTCGDNSKADAKTPDETAQNA